MGRGQDVQPGLGDRLDDEDAGHLNECNRATVQRPYIGKKVGIKISARVIVRTFKAVFMVFSWLPRSAVACGWLENQLLHAP